MSRFSGPNRVSRLRAERPYAPFARLSAVRSLPAGGRGAGLLVNVVGASGAPGKDRVGAVAVSRRSGALVEPAARGPVRPRRSGRPHLRAGSPRAPLVAGIQAPPRREVAPAGRCPPGGVPEEQWGEAGRRPAEAGGAPARPLAGLQLAGRGAQQTLLRTGTQAGGGA